MSNRVELDTLRANRAALVSALAEAGAEPNGDTLRCPFHRDEHASGRIHQDGDVWRFYCMAGCEWNGGKKSGDVLDVLGKVRGLDYAGTLAAVGIATDGNGNGHTAGGTAAAPHATPASGVPDRGNRTGAKERPSESKFDAAALAAECAARLQADPAALARLWTSRAVDADTARRLGLGIDRAGRYWTFPVEAGGQVIAIKSHRADPAGDGPKNFWTPTGTPSRHLYPVCLEPAGPVWLTPGELKGCAIIAAGRAAVGVTCGETVELPDELAGVLQGRPVAIVGDDDDTGRKWVRAATDKLTAAGLDVRAVDLGLSKADGLKDIADLIVSRALDGKAPDEIAAELDEAYRRADPWASFTLGGIWADPETWAPVYHVPTGLTALDTGLGGLRVGGCHLIVGKSGRAKTTLTMQVALNAARAGVPVGVVSLEMSRRDVGHLVAANLADVPRRWIADGKLSGMPAERVRAVLQESAGLPLVVADDSYWRGPLTRSELARIVADGCRRFGWRLVVLDYLGLLANEKDDTSPYAADLENSAALKRIARTADVALIVVAALRKYPRADEAPASLDDVLGAGRIAYDAVNVFNVDCGQAGAPPGGRATGIIRVKPLKSRYAGLASIQGRELQFRWWPGCGRIFDLEGIPADDGTGGA